MHFRRRETVALGNSKGTTQRESVLIEHKTKTNCFEDEQNRVKTRGQRRVLGQWLILDSLIEKKRGVWAVAYLTRF